MNTGNFFRVDRRVWGAVCGLGMNPAVAYLVLACGTQRNNRDTSWSVQAAYEYGGICPIRGKTAIVTLGEGGYVVKTKGGTRPHYEIPTGEEVLGAWAARLQGDAARWHEWSVYQEIRAGKQPSTKLAKAKAEWLLGLGLVRGSVGAYRDFTQPDLDPSAEYIWLPKTLVTGTAKGEDSPVSRIRRTQDVMTLRLLVDLYHAQNLRDDGGVSRKVLSWDYERAPAGEQSIYSVWVFKKANGTAHYGPITAPHWQDLFWPRFQALQREGLVTFVPHLCESGDPGCEVIHPYGCEWNEQELGDLENAVGLAANNAGLAMADDETRTRAAWRNGLLLAPVSRSYPDVQMVGIARLRYRPHTRMTSEWWKNSQLGLPKYIEKYNELAAKAEQSRTRVTA